MNFYRRNKKVAWNRGVLNIYEPVRQNPYETEKPGIRDNGQTTLTTLGDEVDNGSVGGTRARDKEFPKVGPDDDYDLQRKKTVPESFHSLLQEPGKSPFGEGANDDRFVDWRDKPVDIYEGTDPIGPHNMQRFRTVLERAQQKLQGV
jgi:hypothetical protein